MQITLLEKPLYRHTGAYNTLINPYETELFIF